MELRKQGGSPLTIANTAISIVNDNVLNVPSDLLLLKHAGGLYGVDRAVAEALFRANVCAPGQLDLAAGEHFIVDAGACMTPSRVMFLGTTNLRGFGYNEMREFAWNALLVLSEQHFTVQRLTTTIHGANYGMDVEESLQSLISGFQEGLESTRELRIGEIVIVERSSRRAEQLANLLNDRIASSKGHREFAIEPLEKRRVSPRLFLTEITDQKPPPVLESRDDSGRKRHVFVAMPFSEEFEDVYEFGIYAPVRQCGFICEKTNESAFTGDILQRIRERIETADLVVAEMTGARPNVYLEVGYAWGKGVPVIFLARHGEEMHFDVSRHKCIYYKSIRQLAKDLDKLIRGLLDLG